MVFQDLPNDLHSGEYSRSYGEWIMTESNLVEDAWKVWVQARQLLGSGACG